MRGFGTVFIQFSVEQAADAREIAILTSGLSSSLGARSARFFKDFRRFGAENPKIFLVEGGLEVAAQGSGWFLSAPDPNRSP